MKVWKGSQKAFGFFCRIGNSVEILGPPHSHQYPSMFPVKLACQCAWAKVQQEAEAAKSHRPESKGNDDQEDGVDSLIQLDTIGKVGNCSCFMLLLVS